MRERGPIPEGLEVLLESHVAPLDKKNPPKMRKAAHKLG